MSNAETRAERKQQKIERKQEKMQAKLQKKQEKLENAGKFKRWRNRRPFWGATLSALAGLMILYIPVQLYAIAFIPGSYVFIGFLFGGLVLILGILAFFYPQFSTVLGIITIFLSVLSVMGALGGFLIGTIVGIIGGALCVGWHTEDVPVDRDRPKQDKPKRRLKKKDQTIDQGNGTTTSV
jgi:predicted RND superfamily exporter protein